MSKEHSHNQNNTAETKGSSTATKKGTEVTSPTKNRNQNKRKGGLKGKKQEHDQEGGKKGADEDPTGSSKKSVDGERTPKKKKPTPVNSGTSAEDAAQPCLAQ